MSFRHAILLVTMALLLAACAGRQATRPAAHGGRTVGGTAGAWHDDLSRPQSGRYRDRDDSVPPPIDVSGLPEPVPRVEPRALYGNKSPYTVLGRTYTVLPDARGYVERGLASFYGTKFHGYKTSTLEDYDMYKFTAASRVLPLPSYARVTNLENGKSVIVRVNDRGPFHEDRLIDLSYAAAVKIGIWPRGTGRVEVRAIDPEHPERTVAAPPLAARSGGAAAPAVGAPVAPGPASAGAGPVFLQVGAFADAGNAERMAERLRAARLAPVQVLATDVAGRRVNRVRIGPLEDPARAEEISARIAALGLPRPQLAVD